MIEDFITNKYFVIALLIAIIILLFLYNHKEPCSIEKMQTVCSNHNISSTLSSPSTPINTTVKDPITKTVENNIDNVSQNDDYFIKNKSYPLLITNKLKLDSQKFSCNC